MNAPGNSVALMDTPKHDQALMDTPDHDHAPMAASCHGQASTWRPACRRGDLVQNSGIVALVDEAQIALFYLPDDESQTLYAIDNRDPKSGANVLGRGIVGHLGGELVVASPLYKQHFRLRDGQCVEYPEQRVRTWRARFNGDVVETLAASAT